MQLEKPHALPYQLDNLGRAASPDRNGESARLNALVCTEATSVFLGAIADAKPIRRRAAVR
ncbi:hypothetical protein C2I33_03625 [Ralstonia solanacearum]|uniref:hypothetical protein n=1 Tax=Ralstonia solanacearum TaxID=305 RepID=UPI0001816547|nr:hypothetical protein [Ralstonia solanacearum]MDC6177221.1 hypothetical protein [Ralstonia solanacearum]MDC6210220.1 hypothetical protein [Ralstonia solanacearum]MDC6237870.1 hypothetical protein [Ralstonia solanacearum]MDD7799586.1 hypothetical protein [Ralstonia solanacearum]QHB55711.1 hypothetical protein GRB31_11825 [Ralstonia solanacearum]